MTLGSHQRVLGKSQNHFTPKWIIDALGPFDLDPCAGSPRPWDCARTNICEPFDGLRSNWVTWAGLVWLNPPFHRYHVGAWIARLAEHNNGIALLHARTETEWFAPCWRHASALLFMSQRIHFCLPDGTPQPANSGAPPVLVAFGDLAYRRLRASGIAGAFVFNWELQPAQETTQWTPQQSPSASASRPPRSTARRATAPSTSSR